ncbi:evolutionarily conserved signaling intermediate in Toll pathway, mitochondrial [Neocloeon triangulifer]|uniref:evolutionarily conserved signaling intermediate in Toll pathway, mitochondrial n=1 Tax=Neocloeon triangulifer TaxID=2078957 RepID=UPI00286EB4F6|nr:evolutionarily conserved signaling intermediate in Toll pathway, mitochondrial [Neocloeon triangulifer]
MQSTADATRSEVTERKMWDIQKSLPPLVFTFTRVEALRRCVLSRRTLTAFSITRALSLSSSLGRNEERNNKEVATKSLFDVKEKNKRAYIDMIRKFNERQVQKRGHVEFIYAAMKHMDEFGVSKDLEVYKALIDVFPKGKMIPRNMFQTEFQHYPKHQQCAIDLLQMMETNGIIPDMEVEVMLTNIFGKTSHPLRKFMRMYYWMPKFNNLSPWPVAKPVPQDPFELAKIALQRITSVDLLTKIEVYQTKNLKDSVDKTWIVSAQSPLQKEILERLPSDQPLYVEGAFKIWLRQACVQYFILRGQPKPYTDHETMIEKDDVSRLKTPFSDEKTTFKNLERLRTVHEQAEGTVIAIAATGSSSKDSLLSWIRFLQQEDQSLGRIPVLFSMTSPFGQVVSFEEDTVKRTVGVEK